MNKYQNKRVYLVEFSNGQEETVYARDAGELARLLKNYRSNDKLYWDCFIEITEYYY